MKNVLLVSLMGVSVLVSQAVRADETAGTGGLIVCLGEKALERLSDEWDAPGCTLHCLVTSDAKVGEIRAKIKAAGCHGKVSVAKYDGHHLPYIDNLVTRMVVLDEACGVSAGEITRVLAPYGTVIALEGSPCMPQPAADLGEGCVVFKKPYPENMDEWPQYLHGADNNCVARDSVVGPPRHVQWISGPAWTRAHIGAATISSMVSSGGRLFTIEDTETAENPLLPAKWKLVARDAFNGIVLWTVNYPNWEQVTVYIKNYHVQMQRRLVADENIVYCTPGLTAPVTALDAATGKVLKEYKGTEGTQEFVLHEGRLYLIIGDRMRFYSYRGARTGAKPTKAGKDSAPPVQKADPEGRAFNGDGFPLSAYNPQTPNAKDPACLIVALDAASGEETWRSEKFTGYTGCSMALKGGRLVYQSTQGVFCLDARSGKEQWAVSKEIPYGHGSMPHSLVLSDDAVYSEEGARVFAYALKDGSDYWGKSIAAHKGYQASTDLLIAAGALWTCGNCNNAKGVVLQKPTSYDLKTGDKVTTIGQVLSKPMGHDRCFRNFITERYFINSKTGGPDCMEFKTGKEYPTPFARATCSMGHLPCNGLIYCGPWSCQCHLPVSLHNFNAYYTNENSLGTQKQVINVPRAERLEKGGAYGGDTKVGDAPWPTYRQDARRYSGTQERVPAKGLRQLWTASFNRQLTASVIAEGKVFVAETETHTLRALEASSGKALWEYTAGGRIDAPPTYHAGLLLFGSRDGWLHCVRASDGMLSWRFRDLPERLICSFGQLESPWPLHGSVLVRNGIAYFCAGRTSYLDGGLFLYAMEPATGKLLHRRNYYGPYGEDGFPVFAKGKTRDENEVILGTTADVMSSENDILYIRQRAFHPDLTDAVPGKHLLASAGMLESRRQHREYKLVQEDFNHRKKWTNAKTEYPTGDIIASDGTDYYSVFGHPVNRGDTFNPRKGYLITAKTRSGNTWLKKWIARIQITGKAMLLAGDTLFVIGAPLVFQPGDLGGTYAGRCGSILLSLAATDGSVQAQYKLDKLPAWDGMAAAYGRLFIVNQDGSVACWGE